MSLASHIERVLWTLDQITTRVFDLAAQISADLSPFSEPLALVDVANNTFLFLADLALQILFPVTVDFIRAKSYGSRTLSISPLERIAIYDQSYLCFSRIHGFWDLRFLFRWI
ncbi:hypothetical protein ACFX2J_029069 [Malus domestica]